MDDRFAGHSQAIRDPEENLISSEHLTKERAFTVRLKLIVEPLLQPAYVKREVLRGRVARTGRNEQPIVIGRPTIDVLK